MQSNPCIVVIDDETAILRALERILGPQPPIVTFSDPENFLIWLQEQIDSPAVVISDQKMPRFSGTQVLNAVRTKFPHAVRILLSGYSELESTIRAINEAEIYRYISKPWETEDLKLTIKEAYRKYYLEEQARRLDQAKTDFLLTVQHELRTPLTSILNYVYLLETEPSDTAHIQKLKKQVTRLHELIEDTLALTELELKEKSKNPIPFLLPSLESLLDQDLQKIIEQRNLKISYNWPKERFYRGDPELVKDVLKRLLKNALCYSTENSEILLNCETRRPHRDFLAIVSQGAKIPQELIDQIGKPFLITQNPLMGPTGRGLGLGICQRKLKLIGSKLEIHHLRDGNKVGFELTYL